MKLFLMHSFNLLVTCLVWRAEALHYKPEGRAFNSRWCHWNFT